jgi:hypothetical protein
MKQGFKTPLPIVSERGVAGETCFSAEMSFPHLWEVHFCRQTGFPQTREEYFSRKMRFPQQ